jgi:aminomethyltransferase
MADRPASDLKSVLLGPWHEAHGGRMVPFAGYAMPVQYPAGIIAEHTWTRTHAGLFDVSHMGPSFIELADRSGDAEADHAAVAALIEPLLCGDIAGLEPGRLRYTLLLNADGGTLDDLMVGRSPLFPGSLYVIVNAGTKDADFALIEQAIGGRARLTRADDGALLALQGPEAVAVMGTLIPGVERLAFMHYAPFDWNGTRLIVSRSGYTGEDGVEILCAADHAQALWETLAADPRV